jgi:cytochrome c oxidase subunit III
MATMVTSTKIATKRSAGGGPKTPGPNGNGRKKDGDHFVDPDSRAQRYRIGMWVGLASIAMMFTALSSAYIVRAGTSNDWYPLAVPRVLFFSTALILISSGTLEVARRKLKAAVFGGHSRWLMITALLGLAFLVSQVIAWRQLSGQGIYVASNPHSSFFYLLTVAHALHLFGGLVALLYLIVRTRQVLGVAAVDAKRRAVADAVSMYWHFMDVLWIYLFVLLFFWR